MIRREEHSTITPAKASAKESASVMRPQIALRSRPLAWQSFAVVAKASGSQAWPTNIAQERHAKKRTTAGEWAVNGRGR